MVDTNVFNKSVGLLKLGSISPRGYNPATGKIFVQLNESVAVSKNDPIEVFLPLSFSSSNGMCIGSIPAPGTQVTVSQQSGGQYYFVSYLNPSPKTIPDFNSNQLLIKSNDKTKITLDTKNDIYIGSENNRLHINSSLNLLSANFNNNYNYTQASRSIDGLVKRDIRRNTQIPQSFKLDDEIYESMYYTIGLDPMSTSNGSAIGSKKNPPLVEQRELIYEFQYSSNVKNDLLESSLYANTPLPPQDNNYINRRQSRADTLSLTLLEPNYLMETVKGTVVDIFGNILDLNRVPLGVGQGQNTLRADKSTDKLKSFLQIKELERKSLAYHFEINARKDLAGSNGQVVLPDINSNADYARNRSRLFIDIDKEGQFKINVPASSEKGNIPLLTRYENFSSYAIGTDGTVNPNRLIYREDNLDIFQDSFSAPALDRYAKEELDLGPTNKGSITIKNEDAIATPIDRITEKPIMHGTAYHDILTTCYSLTDVKYINYQNDTTSPEKNIDVDGITTLNANLNNIVTNTINIGGDKANAGGRSGSLNLDGSLELNIGANTIDRQSMWVDMAGGVVANIGRDIKNKSLAMNMDGDVYIQLGGIGISADSRFAKQYNGHYGAVLDLRVLTDGGFATMLRIDKNGVQVLTPSFVQIHAGQGMKITSDGDINIDAETLLLQGRMVLKEFGGSI